MVIALTTSNNVTASVVVSFMLFIIVSMVEEKKNWNQFSKFSSNSSNRLSSNVKKRYFQSLSSIEDHSMKQLYLCNDIRQKGT